MCDVMKKVTYPIFFDHLRAIWMDSHSIFKGMQYNEYGQLQKNFMSRQSLSMKSSQLPVVANNKWIDMIFGFIHVFSSVIALQRQRHRGIDTPLCTTMLFLSYIIIIEEGIKIHTQKMCFRLCICKQQKNMWGIFDCLMLMMT